MGLESAVYLGDLIVTNPTASDPISQGDDHLRLTKSTLLNSLCGFPGAIAVTGTDGGAVNAYTLTPASTLPAYGNRMLAVFSPTVTNTGACTLAIGALGVKALTSVSGAPLVANDLLVGSIYAAYYNGTQFQLLSVTKNYADQLVFAGVLPAQTGNAGKLLQTSGAAALWSGLLNTSVIRFSDSTDVTKLVAFNAASITTATTRTITIPDKSGTMAMLSDLVSLVPYMKVSDQKASNTGGGNGVGNDITQTRTLNTVESNGITGASLATNTVTLPAGTYQARARAPAASTQIHKAFLYNSSDSTYTLIGSSSSSNSASTQVDSTVCGQFTIATSKNFTLRHYMGTVTTNSLGLPVGCGQVEVYAELEIWKVA